MQEKKIGCRGSVKGEGGADDETEQTRKREISILKWVGVLSSTQQRGGLCKAAKVGGTPERSSG